MLPRDTKLPPGTNSVLVVDLDAVIANYRRLASRVEDAEVAASIKADAYGLGAVAVAPALAAAGCRTFFVATAAEGVALRPALPEADIVVLDGPDDDNVATLAAHQLTPAVNSLEQLAAWRAGVAGAAPGGPVYLHIDTGMARLGLSDAEVDRLCADPGALAGVPVSVVMSHLACADQPDAAMNRQQLDRLQAAAAKLTAVIGPVRTSLANSPGIFLGARYHLDMVRPGAALYGLRPLPDKANEMRPVVYLYGKILQVREVDRPMTVGYGATHHVSGPGRIATVATGYADGYLRAAGRLSGTDTRPTATAYVGDVAVPVVGRVSMDLLTLDVSVAPPAAARPGRFTELLSERVTADDLADVAGTIGYEVLARLGQRHHRIYRGGAGG